MRTKNAGLRKTLYAVYTCILMILCMMPVCAHAATDAARIGETKFATVMEAINAAQAGDTIVFLRDVEEDIQLIDKDVTLDLQGNTLFTHGEIKANNKLVMIYKKGGNVKIKNGTLAMRNGMTEFSGYVIYSDKETDTTVSSSLTLESMKISGFILNGYNTGLIAGSNTSVQSVALNDVIISDNTIKTGIDLVSFKIRYPSVVINNCTFENNTVGKNILGVNGEHIQITNSSFIGNTGRICGALYYYGAQNGVIDNVEFIGNKATGTSDAAGAICMSNGAELTIRNSRFERNDGTSSDSAAGGILVSNSSLTLENTVITGNKGSAGGGLAVYGGNNKNVSLTISAEKPGAIYGNSSTLEGYLHDIGVKVVKYSKNSVISVPAASAMKDGEKSFAGYAWISSESEVTEDAVNLTFSGPKQTFSAGYTAGIAAVFDVAKNVKTGKTYTDLQKAIDEASDGDTVQLLPHKAPAGSTDKMVKTVISRAVIGREHAQAVKLDLNGCELTYSRDNVLTVKEGSSLEIVGDGEIVPFFSYAAIHNEGTLKISAPVTAKTIESDGSLTIAANADIETIILGKNQVIQATSAFAPSSPVTVVLDKDELASLNNAQTETKRILIQPADGALASSLAGKMKLEGAQSTVSVQREAGNVVAVARLPEGVFIDGVNGSDENDGLSLKTPVKTFEKAKSVLEQNEQQSAIYVLDTVSSSSGEETWTLESGKSLRRYPSFKGNLVKVGGVLTLKNITIDGFCSSDYDSVSGVLVLVPSGTSLNIRDGAILKNNYNTGNNYGADGGAVRVSGGVLNMTGGSMTGNRSSFGAGVMMVGGTFNMSGGTISGNKAVKTKTNSMPMGGGAELLADAVMNFTGGTISKNTSEYWAGGIGVGGTHSAHIHNELNMTGGTITGNESKCEGAGMFIQCSSVANITRGSITRNICHQDSPTRFGGGGIYVNGMHHLLLDGLENGKLYLTDALITGNIALEGAGFAGCETSMTMIYKENSGAIFGNTATKGKVSELLFAHGTLSNQKLDGMFAEVAETMLGGGLYRWTDEDGNPLRVDKISIVNSLQGYNNAPTASAKAKAQRRAQVVISGNSSSSRGGGIGSNGYVQIGTPSASIELQAEKLVNGAEPLAGEIFTFELKGEGVSQKATNRGSQIEFEKISYSLSDSGKTFAYTIAELDAEGYVMDKSVYTVSVSVKGDTEETLSAHITSIDRDGKPANLVCFENERIETPENMEQIVGQLPSTGDRSDLVLYAAMSMFAAAGCALLRRRRKA